MLFVAEAAAYNAVWANHCSSQICLKLAGCFCADFSLFVQLVRFHKGNENDTVHCLVGKEGFCTALYICPVSMGVFLKKTRQTDGQAIFGVCWLAA
jgi:hypothetical protein